MQPCEHKLTARRRPPSAIANLGSIPQVGNTLFVVFMYLQVKASSLDLQMPARGRVAPKLACVQDIRPHVPELGCTSAVQNEKYIFHFVLLSATGTCLCVGTQAIFDTPSDRGIRPVGRVAPKRACVQTARGVRCPKVGNIFYSWYSCICKSRHRFVALICLQMPTRGRVAPKLACVQDIRPHVPELGCTSAVQNEKIHFFILYC